MRVKFAVPAPPVNSKDDKEWCLQHNEYEKWFRMKQKFNRIMSLIDKSEYEAIKLHFKFLLK